MDWIEWTDVTFWFEEVDLDIHPYFHRDEIIPGIESFDCVGHWVVERLDHIYSANGETSKWAASYLAHYLDLPPYYMILYSQ